ncbi:hypothetical protein LOD99_11633 [Oopsacas minuta]|uniref:Uncharacterized protein n=1 Tax=Oopsacas minuta TaxID=111878 RepID=A0AAV7JKH1_9METZ|nr:hypothetical protein LOD99_11633 [Oopsacas minuta]
MKRRVDKAHFSRILKHTESHNKAIEEQIMWIQKKKLESKNKRRFSEDSIENDYPRYSKKIPKVENVRTEKQNEIFEPCEQPVGVDKWGHGGYWELYPELQKDKVRKNSSSDSSEKLNKDSKHKEKLKKTKKTKIKRNKKLKKRQKLQSISSESDF